MCDDNCGSPATADTSSIIAFVIVYTFPVLDDALSDGVSSGGVITHVFG